MASYLQRFDATPPAERWKLVRGWIYGEPLPFFAELRQERPILDMPGMVLAASFADSLDILRRHDLFTVALYRPKQGDYFMAQDDTAVHWRDKAVMSAILDREELPAIRQYVADKAAELLAAADGSMDAVAGLTRAVPLAFVQDWFGLTHKDPDILCRWSYWNQIDTFWNQDFDAFTWPDPKKIVAERERAVTEFAAYLKELVVLREVREKVGLGGKDPVSRLLALSDSKALKFDFKAVGLNASGLLVGAVETTSHAVVNALDHLLHHPDRLDAAREAAQSDDPSAIDGHIFEALRFKPPFPYIFRLCEQDAVLGRGTAHETPVTKGTVVLSAIQSAMFDPAANPNPETFDPTRGPGNHFLFGYGLHECLGKAIGAVMIPEIARQALRLDALNAAPVDRRGGPVPEYWSWRWDA